MYERIPCADVDCPERAECCTTVRWKIPERDYHDRMFREWWLLHEGAAMVEENGTFYIQWPMRCRNVSADGRSCDDYPNRPETCRRYICPRMAGGTEGTR